MLITSANKLRNKVFFQKIEFFLTKNIKPLFVRKNFITIYLIRHTRPDVNKGICYGQSDVVPASSFKQEKNIILDKLKNVRYHIIYSSPLTRCSKLANELNHNQSSIILDDRLLEMNFGKWEMKHWDKISETEVAQAWFKDYIKIRCPGGESYLDLLSRVNNFIEEELKSLKKKESVLIVCHGGTIRAFYSILKNVSLKESFNLKVDFGDIIEIKLEKSNE